MSLRKRREGLNSANAYKMLAVPSSLLERRVDEHPSVALVHDAALFVRLALSEQLFHFLVRQALSVPRQDHVQLRARHVR